MRRIAFRIVYGVVVLGVAYGVSLLAQTAPVAARPAAPAPQAAAAPAIAAQNITEKDLMGGLANPQRWLTVSGDYTGQRFSPLKQITPEDAGQLAAQWT